MIVSNYDKFADVLYLSLGKPTAAITQENDDGLLVRRSIRSNKICGVTIVDFRRYWGKRPVMLARKLADIMSVKPTDTTMVIKSALPTKRRR